MLEDSVLRCFVRVQIGEAIINSVFDAFQDGDDYIIVSEWGSRPDDPDEKQTPKEFFKVPASEVVTAPPERTDYELIYTRVIEWVSPSVTELPEPLPRSFHLPPDD